MDISTLLSGAGQVSTGVRDREEELRRARLQQLTVEDANRRAATERRLNTIPIAEAGSFGDARQPQTVGVRTPPPAAVAPAVPAAPGAGVRTRKPSAVPAVGATVGGVEAVRANPSLSLTREQFLSLPKAEQQRVYQAANQKNAAAVGAMGPMGIYPGITQGKPVPKEVSFDEYVQGLPSASGPSTRRGRRKKAGVATPGNFALDADTAIQKVLGREGGYVNDPDDAGGETNFGISKASFPNLDIAGLTPEAAAQIYKAEYWDAIDADNLPPELREAAFDAAVNQGVPFTRTALANSGRDLDKFLALRKQRYDQIVASRPSQQKFYDGWMARLSEFAGGMAPISTAQAEQPVATLAANDGPALREAIAAGGQRPAGVQRDPARAPAYDPEYTTGRQNTSPAQFYLGNPQALGQDIRTAMMQREELVKLAQIYQQGNMGAEYTQLRQQIMQLDQQMAGLAGIQAVQQMEFSNNPLELSRMLSYFQGQQIDLKPYTDGSFDVLIDGKLAHENVPGAIIKDQALSLFDPQYRAQKAERATETHKANLQTQGEVDKQTAQMIRELKLAEFNGNVEMAKEWIKKQNPEWKVQVLGSEGGVILVPPNGGDPFFWSPEGRTIERDGVEMRITSAQQIAGLR